MADNETKLAAVNPILAERVRKVIASALAEGFTLRVVQGLRTFAEQDALFNQSHDHKDNDGDGRVDEADEHVTNARAGQSNHNYGLACDLAFVVNGKVSWDDHLYTSIGKWAKQAGLEWGGDWLRFKDLPHVQLPNLPKNESVILAVYKRGGLALVWSTFGGGSPKMAVLPAEPPVTHPQLKLGDRGEQVGIMQNALNRHGFAVKVDSIFGKATEEALNNFQESKGLGAEGLVGMLTWAALDK